MKREAIILAGGFGTRLNSMVTDVPKPMAVIMKTPFLEYLLEQLNKFNFRKVILAAGYRHEAIESYFGSFFRNIELIYSIEDEPLGTGGAISMASTSISSDSFFVLNGDTFFEVDYNRMEEKFVKSGAGLMVALKAMTKFERYGTVVINDERIISFNEKKFCKKGLINGGVYLINKNWLNKRAADKVFSFEKEILEKLVSKEEIVYYLSDGYFIDIGIPEDYKKAIKELPGIYPPTPLKGG